MAVVITVTYDGARSCTAEHGPSGARLRTVPPVDNGGDGSSFSPTDLVATGYATCVLTILAMRAEAHGLDLTGTTARVEKHMSADAPRRIVQLPVIVMVPADVAARIPADKRSALEAAACECPVCVTLGDRVKMPVSFEWT